MVCLIFALLSSTALASNQTLILSGFEGSRRETQSFQESAKLAAEASRASGRDVSAAAADGSWGIQNLPAASLMTENELRVAIRAAAKKSASGETLTIALVDHGGPPKSYDDPASAEFILYNKGVNFWIGKDKSVSYRKIGEIIKQEVPEGVTVKFVNSTCFSGGVHEISESLPNVCSASNVDFASLSTGAGSFGKSEHEYYQLGFWDHLKFNPKASLLGAHFSAMISDKDNEGRGTLSSLAYVDKVLRAGAFDLSARGNLDIKHQDLVNGQTKAPSLLPLSKRWYENESVCGSVDSLSRLTEDLEKVLFLSIGDSGAGMESLPPEFKQAFDRLKKEWNGSKDYLFTNLRTLSEKYKKLKREWMALPQAEQDKRRAEFVKEIEGINDMGRPDKRYEYFSRRFSQFERVARFLKTATPDQKKTFRRLLKCESSPL